MPTDVTEEKAYLVVAICTFRLVTWENKQNTLGSLEWHLNEQ
jgi:hypothetical protein